MEAGKEGVRWREHKGAKYSEGHKDRCNDVWNNTYPIRLESQSSASVHGLEVRSNETTLVPYFQQASLSEFRLLSLHFT